MRADAQLQVLIVDDQPATLELLGTILTEYDYRVRTASNSAMALAALEDFHPDLILLDVNMPGEDGYGVCQKIKSLPNFVDVPVIFLSARDDTLDKLRAFEAGAVDYVTKPFEMREVLMRVNTQIALYRQRRELEYLREKDRLVAEKLTTFIQETLRNTSHDLKSPLTGINIAVYVLKRHGTVDDERGQYYLESIKQDVQRMADLIAELTDIARDHVSQDDDSIAE